MDFITILSFILSLIALGIGMYIRRGFSSYPAQFEALKNDLEQLQKKSTMSEEKEGEYVKRIEHLEESTKEFQAHNKMTDILLTKIKGDITKISTDSERKRQEP